MFILNKYFYYWFYLINLNGLFSFYVIILLHISSVQFQKVVTHFTRNGYWCYQLHGKWDTTFFKLYDRYWLLQIFILININSNSVTGQFYPQFNARHKKYKNIIYKLNLFFNNLKSYHILYSEFRILLAFYTCMIGGHGQTPRGGGRGVGGSKSIFEKPHF